MKIKNLEGEHILKYIYSLIKINRQDINKCNILIGTNYNTTSKIIKTLIKLNCSNLNKKNTHKIRSTVILKAFNFKIFNNISQTKLKECTMLGNYDIGVLLKCKNNKLNVYICAGNQFSLSLQKKNEFKKALLEFDGLNNKNIHYFFSTESKKESIKPLSLKQINKRKKQNLNYLTQNIKIH